MTGEKAAAIAVSLLFFVCCVLCVASKIRTGFRLYLLLGLSTLRECHLYCFTTASSQQLAA